MKIFVKFSHGGNFTENLLEISLKVSWNLYTFYDIIQSRSLGIPISNTQNPSPQKKFPKIPVS